MRKKIVFIAFLITTNLSLANFFSANNLTQASGSNKMIGGCTQGSLGPAYSSSICNNDGTYKSDVKHVVHHHIWNFPGISDIPPRIPMVRHPMGR